MTTAISPAEASLSVTDLLQRAGHRDPRAWEEIVHRYRGVVIGKVRSFGLQDADAHDAVQMTWLRLAENCHRILLPEQLAGWLATMKVIGLPWLGWAGEMESGGGEVVPTWKSKVTICKPLTSTRAV